MKVSDYQRINIRVSPEMLTNLDAMARKYAMARTNLIVYYIGKMLAAEMKADAMMNEQVVTSILSDLIKDQSK